MLEDYYLMLAQGQMSTDAMGEGKREVRSKVQCVLADYRCGVQQNKQSPTQRENCHLR